MELEELGEPCWLDEEQPDASGCDVDDPLWVDAYEF